MFFTRGKPLAYFLTQINEQQIQVPATSTQGGLGGCRSLSVKSLRHPSVTPPACQEATCLATRSRRDRSALDNNGRESPQGQMVCCCGADDASSADACSCMCACHLSLTSRRVLQDTRLHEGPAVSPHTNTQASCKGKQGKRVPAVVCAPVLVCSASILRSLHSPLCGLVPSRRSSQSAGVSRARYKYSPL